MLKPTTMPYFKEISCDRLAQYMVFLSLLEIKILYMWPNLELIFSESIFFRPTFHYISKFFGGQNSFAHLKTEIIVRS